MKRKLLLVIIAILAVSSLCAAPVGRERAQQIAADFARRDKLLSRSMSRGDASASLQIAVERDELFVFNVGTDGFVVVSGDDLTMPVLGYAAHGTIAEGQMPPALKAWMNGLCDEVRLLNSRQGAPRLAEARDKIDALLSTQWDQGDPYNAQCPVYNDERCVTGCVATAMAQIMNYHQWPQDSTVEILPYQTRTLELVVDTMKSTQFDWSQTTNPSNSEVARLLAYCGASVGMDYSTIESSASSSDVPNALVRYFGYGPYESYKDKHRASVKHLYDDTVDGMFEDYIRPQENGNRWNCDYVRLTGPLGGLEVTGEEFSFNVSRFTQEELTQKAHNFELEPCGDTVFCLDYRQNGIGSNSCGPELNPRYAMPEELTFEFSLQPWSADEE